MTPELGILWIAVLLSPWYFLRLFRQASKEARAKILIDETRELRNRGVWFASMRLHDAQLACYEAEMIEEYQDLHEWFYGRRQ